MSAPQWAPGHIVGAKYTVHVALGHGERMRTYAALTEPNREVVLRAVGSEDARVFDELEARLPALAALSDAYVLRALEVVRDAPSGARFVVSDRSRNPSLAALVELCPLTLTEGIAFAKKLAVAVDSIHDKDIVHLALRPTSVFIGPMPSGGVEVADIGVARLDDADDRRWCAPEQPGAATAASDVFTCALLVFFALTGKTYWKGTSAAEIAAEVSAPRVPASQRAAELGVTLPSSLDAAFEKALASAPSRRPTQFAEFAHTLEAASGSAKSEKVEIVPPPDDVIAGLIATELKNANVVPPPIPPKPGEAASSPPNRPVVQPAVDSAPPVVAPPLLAPPPPMSPIAVSSFTTSPIDDFVPQTPKRRTALVVGIVGGALVLALTAGAISIAGRKGPAPDAGVAATTASAITQPSAMASLAAPSASASATGPTALGPMESEISVTCEPTCDLVMVDRKRMDSFPAPLKLPPGQHGVGVSSSGYWGDWKLVETHGGERTMVNFVLKPKPAPAVASGQPTQPVPSATTKKNCGKFLKRCD